MFYLFSPATPVLPSRTKYVVPEATYTVTWGGQSDLLARFPLDNTTKLAIKLPVTAPNSTYVLAVAWDEGTVQYRYLFWDAGSIYFPVYNGESIGASAWIEVWSIGDVNATVPATTLYSSYLNEVAYDCGRENYIPDVSVTLTATPFTQLDPGDPDNPFDFPLIT